MFVGLADRRSILEIVVEHKRCLLENAGDKVGFPRLQPSNGSAGVMVQLTIPSLPIQLQWRLLPRRGDVQSKQAFIP